MLIPFINKDSSMFFLIVTEREFPDVILLFIILSIFINYLICNNVFAT